MRARVKVMTLLAAGALAGSAAVGVTATAATAGTTTPTIPAAAPAAPSTLAVPAKSQKYKVLARANFRSGPGTKYKKIGTLRAGAKVTGTGKYKKIAGTKWYWVQVKTAKGQLGWVSTGYLKAVKR